MDFYTSVRVYGKNILYRGVENGRSVSRRIEYCPTFFVPSPNPSKYKTLDGKSVEPIKPGNMRDAREFLEKYKNVDNFPIYGNNKYEYTFISDEYPDDIHWDKSNINIAYLDIEVESENGFPEPREANERILAITYKMNGVFHIFGLGSYAPKNENEHYTKCGDESELLKKFLDCWTTNYPHIISGWNVKFFDIPYLFNRMTKVLGDSARSLSPWRIINEREAYVMNRKNQWYDVYGIPTLDYMELFKKFSPVASQESYRLDHIAQIELGVKKLDYSEYETLHQLYKKNFQKYIEYNVHDCDIVEQIEEKGLKSSKLIELALTLAYDNKVNLDDVFMQVRMWDAIIFNHLRKKNIVIPQNSDNDKSTAYSGAYVKEPVPGAYDWVVSFDLNSLYPHLIMQYNISPETLVQPEEYTEGMQRILERISVESLLNKKVNLDDLKKYRVTVTPNAQLFSLKNRGFLPEIMDSMYKDRTRYKKLAIEAKKKLQAENDPHQKRVIQREIARYNNLQLAKKVSLNSAYGAAGNQYFRFFDIRIAEAITLGGQLSYKWIEQHINEYLNKLLKTEGVDYVIAGDTDSMYLNLEPLVKKIYAADGKISADTSKIIDFLDRVCEDKIQPFIDKTYQELADYTNAYEQKMQMKRESLCDRAIWTAKKRYILNVWDSEGVRYKEPEIKITGLEAIKSSTPAVCRDKIKQCIKIMLEKDNDAVIDFIEEFRKEFKTLPVEDVAFPRSVNSLDDYADGDTIYRSGTPMHVKGALIYNDALAKNKLTKKYQLIKGGEKIKYAYLKHPNPYGKGATCITFITVLPKELKLHPYIDYNAQFEGAFLEPMKTVLSCIGWKVERVSTLESLFV